MLNTFFTWLVQIILKLLVSRLEREANKAIDMAKKEAEREEIAKENIKKYEQAIDRKEKVEASLSMLNGTKSN